ncbi:MAG TPA: peptidase M22 [Candidatus Didemnitutus sp.]|jgi:tRNA threonylcarbamoyladenosine biosynthesis protein TsaB
MLSWRMTSLTQLIASHGRILVLDASSTRVQVGVLRRDGPPVWQSSNDDAGRGLFAGTSACLDAAGIEIDAVGAFVFCEGPGSMLGIRTTAMAIRIWQVLRPRPVFRYSSLILLAHHLARSDHGPFSVIADARRDTWHVVGVQAGAVSPLRRVPSAELGTSGERLVRPAAFRAWSPPPRAATDCPYDVAALFEAEKDAALLAATDAPDGFQSEPSSYRKWSAQVHSLDSVARR